MTLITMFYLSQGSNDDDIRSTDNVDHIEEMKAGPGAVAAGPTDKTDFKQRITPP